MMNDTVIDIEGLWKRYGLPVKPALRRLIHPFRNGLAPEPEGKGVWSLRGVNLQVKRGESLGIMGRNGAGKSTLLKILAGVTPPTQGKAKVSGRVFPMIELNAGLHMELTGRQNVFMLGAVMGVGRKEIRARLPQIEEFCELGEWFDRPVRTYSSGMLARLGFGVATNVEADILLIDEVLAVGDLSFQKKCMARLEEARRSNTTIILVSHIPRAIQRVCKRAIIMERGQVISDGDSESAVRDYLEATTLGESTLSPHLDAVYSGTGDVLLGSLNVRDDAGMVSRTVVSGSSFSIDIELIVVNPISNALLSVAIDTSDFIRLLTFKTDTVPLSGGRNLLRFAVPRSRFLPGVYKITVGVVDLPGVQALRAQDVLSFAVVPNRNSHNLDGLVYMPARWSLSNIDGNVPGTTYSGAWPPDEDVRKCSLV